MVFPVSIVAKVLNLVKMQILARPAKNAMPAANRFRPLVRVEEALVGLKEVVDRNIGVENGCEMSLLEGSGFCNGVLPRGSHAIGWLTKP